MKPRQTELALLSIAGFALWAGCDQQQTMAPPVPEANAASAAMTSDKDLVAEVKVEENHHVRFYARPSSVFIVEQMPRGNRSAVGAGYTNALEIYSGLRPGEEVPRALREAHERARLVAPVNNPNAGPRLLPSGGSSLAQLATFFQFDQGTSSSNPAGFVNNLDGCAWAAVGSICRVSWFNGFHSGTNTTSVIRCVVDHFSGSGITVRVVSNSTFNSVFQAANTTFVYVETGSSDVRSCEVTDASGDGFHIGTQWL
jgi:hypothetical protein